MLGTAKKVCVFTIQYFLSQFEVFIYMQNIQLSFWAGYCFPWWHLSSAWRWGQKANWRKVWAGSDALSFSFILQYYENYCGCCIHFLCPYFVIPLNSQEMAFCHIFCIFLFELIYSVVFRNAYVEDLNSLWAYLEQRVISFIDFLVKYHWQCMFPGWVNTDNLCISEQLRIAKEKSSAMFDKEKAQERLSKLSGGVAVFKVYSSGFEHPTFAFGYTLCILIGSAHHFRLEGPVRRKLGKGKIGLPMP